VLSRRYADGAGGFLAQFAQRGQFDIDLLEARAYGSN
jgi:hypothetical protein